MVHQSSGSDEKAGEQQAAELGTEITNDPGIVILERQSELQGDSQPPDEEGEIPEPPTSPPDIGDAYEDGESAKHFIGLNAIEQVASKETADMQQTVLEASPSEEHQEPTETKYEAELYTSEAVGPQTTPHSSQTQ